MLRPYRNIRQQAGHHLQPWHQRRDFDRPGHGEGGRHDQLRGRARGGRRQREGTCLRQHPQLERGRRVRRPHAEDPQSLAPRARPAAERTGHGPKNRRLFSGCNGNSKMVVMDAPALPVGRHTRCPRPLMDSRRPRAPARQCPGVVRDRGGRGSIFTPGKCGRRTSLGFTLHHLTGMTLTRRSCS